MKYAFNDLGRQQAGTQVTVQLTGKAANLLLLDEHNSPRYKRDSRSCMRAVT